MNDADYRDLIIDTSLDTAARLKRDYCCYWLSLQEFADVMRRIAFIVLKRRRQLSMTGTVS